MHATVAASVALATSGLIISPDDKPDGSECVDPPRARRASPLSVAVRPDQAATAVSSAPRSSKAPKSSAGTARGVPATDLPNRFITLAFDARVSAFAPDFSGLVGKPPGAMRWS
jgi:hypothetical protein